MKAVVWGQQLKLFRLREQTLPETAKAIWAVFIVVVPVFGALAFLIVQPGDRAGK